jgi:pilus assembly protein CpaE
MSNPETFPVVLVSGDRAFREELRNSLSGVPFLTLGAEISAPFRQLEAGYWEELKLPGPGYLMVDLDPARADALQLIAEVAERKSELKTIAFSSESTGPAILEAMRSGAAEFIHKPVDPKVLMDALLRVRRHFAPRGVPAQGAAKVLTFFSTKGGSGATTVACNTAVALARRTGKPVLLLDLDLQLGELALFLGVEPRYTVLDLLSNMHRADEALLKTFVVKHETGVHLLAGPDAPDTETIIGGEQIRKAIQFLRQHYEYVLIDMPNNYYDYVVATLDQADAMFLVCTADLPSLKNVQRSFTIFEKLGLSRNRVHIVLNRHDKTGQGIDRGTIERIAGKVFCSIPNDYAAVIRSINSGVPLASASGTEIARSFARLAEEIAGGASRPEVERGPRRLLGFLAKNGSRN